jgi:hypothetical protein
MTTQKQSGTDLETHLLRALDAAENSETRYELREALQKYYSGSVEVDSASALDD